MIYPRLNEYSMATKSAKSIAISYFAPKLTKHDATQRIKAFPHVRFLTAKKVMAMIPKHDLAAHYKRSFRNSADTCWKIRIPLTSANNPEAVEADTWTGAKPDRLLCLTLALETHLWKLLVWIDFDAQNVVTVWFEIWNSANRFWISAADLRGLRTVWIFDSMICFCKQIFLSSTSRTRCT